MRTLTRAGVLGLLVVILAALMLAVHAYQGGVCFADPELERAVREKLNRLEGPVRRTDLLRIARLNAAGRGITRLDGIEHAGAAGNRAPRSESRW